MNEAEKMPVLSAGVHNSEKPVNADKSTADKLEQAEALVKKLKDQISKETDQSTDETQENGSRNDFNEIDPSSENGAGENADVDVSIQSEENITIRKEEIDFQEAII